MAQCASLIARPTPKAAFPCGTGSIKPARAVPLRELDDGAIGIADIELAAYEDAFLAVFFLEDLDAFGGEKGLGRFILLRVHFEGVVCSATVFCIALQRRVASRQNDVIFSCAQKHHARRGRTLYQRQPEDLRIKFTTRLEIADRDAEMNDAFGFDHL